MAASVTSPADVINLALAVLGVPGRVGNLYDGSAAAKKALDVYAETRDEVLRSKDWPFALRQILPTVAAAAVAGWTQSWVYPADCLRIRSVVPAVIPFPNYDPRPLLFTLFNDQTTLPPTKIILTQVAPVRLNYVAQITDPLTWEPLFVNALVSTLAAKLGPALAAIAPAIAPAAALDAATGADDLQAPDDAAMTQAAPPASAAPDAGARRRA